MKTYMISFLLSSLALGFPHIPQLISRDPELEALLRRQDSALETNCGPIPCLTFDEEEQFVSTSGEHVFVAPTESDLRGPCPGLNAAANHGYLPHNGLATIEQSIQGLAQAYGMSADLSAFLSVVSIVFDGDLGSLQYSIGGPFKPSPLSGLIAGSNPKGLSFSHNNFEGDSSVTRADAYLNNGDAFTLIVPKFEALYNTAINNRYTPDIFRGQYAKVQQESIATNPYLFYAPFSSLVVPTAYNFVINFMSNHSAEEPSGYLDGNQLKQFFSITGEPGSFQYTPGHERIPENWYRRPTANQYSIATAAADLVIGYLHDPSTLKFGGNTGTTNSFTGIDVGHLTSGVFDGATLLEGNNLSCFILQVAQAGAPEALDGVLGDLASAINLIDSTVAPLLANLACPQLGQFDQALFDQFPGAKYRPTSTA